MENEDLLDQLDSHLASPNLAWLLGAGISRNANIPLMHPLTDHVLGLLTEKSKSYSLIQAIRNELGERRSNLRPAELMALKEEYGISMAAALYRAKDTGIINEAYAKTCWIRFRELGWHKNEPASSRPPEYPKAFHRLLIRAVAEDMLSLSKAAELKGVSALALQREMQIRVLVAPKTAPG